MVELACMDLAQRKGNINQLKQNLCAYNYLCEQTGFIIENVNNEKLKESITIHRKISGIPCCVELVPVNKEFWENRGGGKEEKDKYREEIDLVIPKLSAKTVVLKMKGGIDHRLIKLFSKEK
jgi:hypothetical protein